MAANKVRADYDTLAEIANSFEREAEKIRKTLTQLHRALDVLLDRGWRGRGSAEFYREMIAQLLPALKRLAEALERAAQAVRQISRIMKRAEDESAALFKTVAPEIEAGPAEGGGAEARGKAPVKAGDPPPWVWSLLPGVPLLAWLLSVLSTGAAAQGEVAAEGEPAAAPSGATIIEPTTTPVAPTTPLPPAATPLPPTAAATPEGATMYVNGPEAGTGKPPVALLNAGTAVQVIGSEAVARDGYNWVEVQTPAGEGWIARELLSDAPVSAVAPLPVVDHAPSAGGETPVIVNGASTAGGNVWSPDTKHFGIDIHSSTGDSTIY